MEHWSDFQVMAQILGWGIVIGIQVAGVWSVKASLKKLTEKVETQNGRIEAHGEQLGRIDERCKGRKDWIAGLEADLKRHIGAEG